MVRNKRNERRAPLAHERRRLEQTAELYLRRCYSLKTAAQVKEFAVYLGVSRQHLSRMFREVLGVTVWEALRRRQVEAAAELLRTSPFSTAEIALRTGFGTEKTFFRALQLFRGMTPQELRDGVTK